MPAGIGLFLDAERSTPLPILALGEVLATESLDDLVEGQPVKIYGRNVGDTNLRNLSVHLSGEGQRNVQLSTDIAGEPGVWAAPGESIVLSTDTLFAGDNFEFWSRALFHAGDAEGRKPLALDFHAMSVG